MNKKAYILSFDSSMDKDLLHNIIIIIHNSGQISNWSRHISNSYILISNHNSFELNKLIGERLGELTKKYFITEINFNNYNGWLPQKAWEWIRKHSSTLNNPFA